MLIVHVDVKPLYRWDFVLGRCMHLTFGSNTPMPCPASMSRRVCAHETLTTRAKGPATLTKILEALSLMNKMHAMACCSVDQNG